MRRGQTAEEVQEGEGQEGAEGVGGTTSSHAGEQEVQERPSFQHGHLLLVGRDLPFQ